MDPEVLTFWTCNGVYYCGDQVWTPDLYPMLPDRWEPHDEPAAEWAQTHPSPIV